MKTEINKTKILTIVWIILIIVLCAIVWFISTQTNKYLNKIQEDKIFVVQKQNIADLANEVGEHKSEVSNLAMRIEDLFLTEKEVVTFLELIESVGRESGVSVTISGVNVSEKTDDIKKLRNLTMIVGANGSLEEVRSYLKKIEKLPLAVSVSSTKISGGVVGQTETAGSAVWNLSFSLEALIKNN